MGGFVVFLNKVVPWQLQKEITSRKRKKTKKPKPPMFIYKAWLKKSMEP